MWKVALVVVVGLGCARKDTPAPVVVDAAVVRPVDAARAAVVTGAERLAAAREAGMLGSPALRSPGVAVGEGGFAEVEPIDVQCAKACEHLIEVARVNTIRIDTLPARVQRQLEAIASTAGGVNRDACEDHCEAGRFQAACTARIETVRDFGRCLTR